MSGGIVPDVPIPVDLKWVESNFGRLIEIQWEAYKKQNFFSSTSLTAAEIRVARRAFFSAIAGSLYFQASLGVSEADQGLINNALQSMMEEAIKTLAANNERKPNAKN